MDAASLVAKEHDIKSENIEAINIGLNTRAYRLCIPEEVKHKPKTIVDAQFSVPYGVVVALADPKVLLSHYSDEAIKRPDLLALLQRVHSEVNPEIEKVSALKAASFARVKVKTKDGKEYETQVDVPKGHSQNPMSNEELADKFRDCAANAARPLSKENVEKAMELLFNLEEVDDVRQIIALLSPSGGED